MPRWSDSRTATPLSEYLRKLPGLRPENIRRSSSPKHNRKRTEAGIYACFPSFSFIFHSNAEPVCRCSRSKFLSKILKILVKNFPEIFPEFFFYSFANFNEKNSNLASLNDSGAIKGMDAREDGVYITYTPTAGADTVTKKLGNLGNTSYIQAEPTYRRVAAEFDVSDCNKILFTCRTSGSAIWFMGSNESTYVINTGTSLGFCTSSANETKEYDVSSYKYFRVEMLGSGIVQNIKFS